MKKIFALIIGVALLALVITGCGKESATDTINKAITKNADTKTAHTDYDVSFTVNGDASALGSEFSGLLPMTMSFKGGLDSDTSSEPVKMKGDLQIVGLDKILQSLANAGGASIDSQTKDLLTQFGGAFSDLQFVSVDNNGYIKLAGSWYETGDLSSNAGALGSAGALGGVGGLGSLGADASDINSKCYQDAMKDPNKMGADKLFKDVQELSEEKIDGVDTRHFKATIDFDKTLTQLATIARDCGDAEAAGGLETAKSDISKFFKKAEVEMWIDSDNNLRQMKMVLEIDPAAISDMAGSSSSTTDAAAQALDSISMNISVKFSKFNEPMDITKPSGDILKLEDLANNPMIAGLLGGMLGSSGLDSSGLGASDILGGTSTGSSSSSSGATTRTATTSSR